MDVSQTSASKPFCIESINDLGITGIKWVFEGKEVKLKHFSKKKDGLYNFYMVFSNGRNTVAVHCT